MKQAVRAGITALARGTAHAGLGAVARAFSQAYGGQLQEFPAECKEGE